ncbi:hypothetical protein L1049_024847 [Liquidambar formosana]|uniref:VQ domain-containing protein n=1 Tax=Liquidambar formosana TaxID=63359 RepID=A0AAP0S258_LIQFO
MEAYSSYSSSSSSTYLSSSPKEAKKPNPPHIHHSSLHSVRKQSGKPWKKPAVAPLPPVPTRVYKVDRINFREVVQKLTGAPESQSRRLQSVAPPPINVAPPPSLASHDIMPSPPMQLFPSPERTPLSAFYKDLMSETLDTQQPRQYSEGITASSTSLGISLSPSSWCSFPLLSPGTLSSLGQSTVI